MIWRDVALPLADVLGCARIEGAPASLNLLEAANTVLTAAFMRRPNYQHSPDTGQMWKLAVADAWDRPYG